MASLDPYRNTREEFTNALQRRPIPDNAAGEWKELVTTLQELHLKLLQHDAMAQNRSQTYMTPAASKNRVYFMWDFVGRTIGNTSAVPPSLADLTPRQGSHWQEECLGRSMFISALIADPAQLDMMLSGDDSRPEFGSEILELAKKLGGKD